MSDAQDKTAGPILVSDFDGTITRRDFFDLVRTGLLPAGSPDHWGDYQAGRITHFDALKNIFAEAAVGEARLIETADKMQPDPDLADEVAALAEAGWRVIVASAGCDWYIRRHLKAAGVDEVIQLHANPGRVEGDRLVMERPPAGAPFYSHEVGVDKVGIVRAALAGGGTVAFSGDGMPDLPPALLVPAQWRFARGTLAEELRKRGEGFRPFERWSEVARALRG
ncbi:HAD-IB family phosphatase [Tundrisphaera sp. TA3]|uniref:HAD-IB family phosphatase n=1 Tax=Tundrisphaera sp. TA3 TaxID=3435775 RepID=UPI003EBDCFF3